MATNKPKFQDNPYDPPGWEKTPEWMRNVAPEHASVAASMDRDYPRDQFGRKLPGTKPELRLDPRPASMVPSRKTYTEQDKSTLNGRNI
jgi:hypothetical protein